jgi:hypothetical protein
MNYTLEFQIAGLTKMSNQLLRGHWTAKAAHARKWKKATATAAMLNGSLPKQPLVSAVLWLTRVSSAEPDFDGLVSGFKPIVDSLVEIGVIASDKPSCITADYKWVKGSKKAGHMRVRVEERTTDAQPISIIEKDRK